MVLNALETHLCLIGGFMGMRVIVLVVMSNTNPNTFDPTVASDYAREHVTEEEINEISDHILVRIAIDIEHTYEHTEDTKVVHIPAK